MEEIFDYLWEKGDIMKPKGRVLTYSVHDTLPIVFVGYCRAGAPHHRSVMIENGKDFNELKSLHKDVIRLADSGLPPIFKIEKTLKTYAKIVYLKADSDLEKNCFHMMKSKKSRNALCTDRMASDVCTSLTKLITDVEDNDDLELLRIKMIAENLPDNVLPHLFKSSLSLGEHTRFYVAEQYLKYFQSILSLNSDQAKLIRNKLEDSLSPKDRERLNIDFAA